jgi:haloacid dehalogenase-like hydrolase.
MYKAVFSDFDGTLLTSDHRISPKTLDAIQRITKQGIPFTPISARSPLGIWPYAKLIENYNIIVAFSGALILDKSATPIYSVQIDPADIQAINQVLADHPALGVNYYTYDDCVARDLDNKWVIYERSVTGIQIDPYDESSVYSPHKIQIIGETDEVIGMSKS